MLTGGGFFVYIVVHINKTGLFVTISDMVCVLQQKSRVMLIVFCPKFHAVFLNDVIVCRTHVGCTKYTDKKRKSNFPHI
jgi:hypothetical protein